jgi:hypothetical protein
MEGWTLQMREIATASRKIIKSYVYTIYCVDVMLADAMLTIYAPRFEFAALLGSADAFGSVAHFLLNSVYR